MPKIVDHDAYREELLSQCFEIFARDGYAALTLRKLASTLGISTGKLYHYFPSKEAIFEQMIAMIASRDILRILERVEPGHTAEDRIRMVTAFVESNEEHLANFLVIIIDYIRQQRDLSVQLKILKLTYAQYIQAITLHIEGLDAEAASLMVDLLIGTILRRVLVREDRDSYEAHARLALMLLR